MGVLEQFSLVDKRAIVTGGEGLLGRMICETIRELGGEAISIDITGHPKEFCDITDPDQVAGLMRITGPVDIIVNNAVGRQKAQKDAAEGYAQDLNVSLVGSLNMIATFGSAMTNGVILNIGSDMSFIAPDARLYKAGTNKPVSYSVVKHGMVGMTKYFAALWGGKVRVNCLCPGGVDVGQKVPWCPMNRLARLEEMKGPIAFLLSDASSYVTGATLLVDGGRTCV